MWTLWTAPMMYQFSSFIDTPSFQLAHRTVPLSNFDYAVKSKRSPGVEDFWIEAFNVTVLDVPPAIIRYNNENEWGLELDTNSPLNRTIQFYDVHNYQFHVDTTTNVCSIYTYPIKGVDVINNTFLVEGDQTLIFSENRTFSVIESTANDTNYTVLLSTYNAVNNTTIVEVNNNILDTTIDGLITVDYRTLPWNTGDIIWVSSEELLPVPLEGDTAIGTTMYFIIKINDTQFKIAETFNDAISNIAIDILNTGKKNHYVGQIVSTFNALANQNTNVLWKHYAIDKTNILSFTPPQNVQGMQNLVNIIDGYGSYVEDQGWALNVSRELRDPNTGSFINWQLETERFINFAYGIKRQQIKIADKFEVQVNELSNVWTLLDSGSHFVTGDVVNIITSNGVQPTPIVSKLKYYIIRDSISDFRLAATKHDAEQGKGINILSVVGVDKLYITAAVNVKKNRPSHEINPFRNGIWFRPQRGIISNLLVGPSEDLRTT
jgi:hypothetical protein